MKIANNKKILKFYQKVGTQRLKNEYLRIKRYFIMDGDYRDYLRKKKWIEIIYKKRKRVYCMNRKEESSLLVFKIMRS